MTINNIPSTLEKLTVPIDGLRAYGKNPRNGDVKAIADSLRVHGQYRPIVVRSGSNEVLAGNHTLKAARDELGWDQIAVTFVDVDDDEAARIVLVDNRLNDIAVYDEVVLIDLLQGLPDLDGTGFTADAFDALLGDSEQSPAETPDDVDDMPESITPVAKPGDVFDLGPHRVICGDSTEATVVSRLMGAEKARCMWTDPPYGVSYVGKTADALTIDNDGASDLDGLLDSAFRSALEALEPGAAVYVAHSDTRRISFESALLANGYLVRQNLIWDKGTLVLGHSDYQYQHEPILYGFTPDGEGRLGRGGPKWYGPNNAVTVFNVPKPPRNKEHPTMKPVDLILAMFANSVKPGHIVFDPFGGSGSTLIAAHFHGAVARLIELDPKYVDVICARYQRITGETPIRAGKPVDFQKEGDDGDSS